MKLTATAYKRLEHVPRALHSEFPAIPIEEIESDLEAHVRHLLEQAHFDDFVPLLARRAVREHLRRAALTQPASRHRVPPIVGVRARAGSELETSDV